MIAAWYERNGAAAEVLRVGEQPDPQPGPGEVRVALHAAGINPSDVKTRAGLRRKIAFPRVIPGCDGAGVIDRVGAGVPSSRLGERVWVYEGQWNRAMGTSAAHIALPAALAVPLPAALSFEDGACLGVPYMTAHRAVFADGPVSGLTLLVQGGAGVVAHYAIQLAKWGGATVIATVSGDAKAAHARRAGADHVVNYRTEKVAERVRALTAGKGVDRIIEVEFGQNVALDMEMIRLGGVIASYGSNAVAEPVLPYFAMVAKNAVIRMILVYSMPPEAKQQAIRDLEPWSRARAPVFAVAARFPLQEVIAAHQKVESGDKTGHVLLLPPAP
jgi:NADPH2:quinone reductase